MMHTSIATSNQTYAAAYFVSHLAVAANCMNAKTKIETCDNLRVENVLGESGIGKRKESKTKTVSTTIQKIGFQVFTFHEKWKS